jgi:chromatin structure-remodeling complex subunit RSC1/2
MEDSPPPDPEEEEAEEEEEEEEDDDEDEDSDEEGGRRRKGRRGRPSTGKRDKGDEGKDEESHKKRGRPPKVFTPMEARIQALLKGLRKPKTADGELLIVPFEKLPEPKANSEYYAVIKNPMALDLIKRKAKRKKYQNVDQALADVERMFENAKLYNEDDSQVYKDAEELLKIARELAAQEKAKPDNAFRDDDGKLPLPEIVHNGETWRVGESSYHIYGASIICLLTRYCRRLGTH